MFTLLPQACRIHVNSLKRHINTKKWQWQSLCLHTLWSACTANVHMHTLTSSLTHTCSHTEKGPCQDAVNFWGQIHQAPSAAPLLFDSFQGGRDKTPTDSHEPQLSAFRREALITNYWQGTHLHVCLLPELCSDVIFSSVSGNLYLYLYSYSNLKNVICIKNCIAVWGEMTNRNRYTREW